MINEYCNKAFIYVEMPIDESNYEAVRKESSVYLHRAMLLCEKWLYQNNEPMALSFIGGHANYVKTAVCRKGAQIHMHPGVHWRHWV